MNDWQHDTTTLFWATAGALVLIFLFLGAGWGDEDNAFGAGREFDSWPNGRGSIPPPPRRTPRTAAPGSTPATPRGAETAGADDVQLLLMPVADEVAPFLMHVAMKRQAHPVLLEIAEKLRVLDMLRGGRRRDATPRSAATVLTTDFTDGQGSLRNSAFAETVSRSCGPAGSDHGSPV